jgi:hypothetical protein
MHMEAARNVQLLLEDDLITVNASLFEGLLTSKTFAGPDCYRLLVRFLRELTSSGDVAINATILIGRK